MPREQRRFADDGWAVWVDGDDTSTVYINDWLNPKGKSYIDFAIRICGVKIGKYLKVYVPFVVSRDEIDDVSLHFNDTKILQAIFSATSIIDYKKNEHTSEIAYNGKTVDIVHVSTLEIQTALLSEGTLITIDLEKLQPYLANDEAYFVWRMPHKSLDDVFKSCVDMGNVIERLRDLIMSPVVSDQYGYSIRINESRLLPEEITHIGDFHRQKLKKAVITISVGESYKLNDAGCYRIRRLEEKLYKKYLPEDYPSKGVITYQWNQTREHNLRGQFNFYYSITRDSISKGSMLMYILLIFVISLVSDCISDTVRAFLRTLV